MVQCSAKNMYRAALLELKKKIYIILRLKFIQNNISF